MSNFVKKGKGVVGFNSSFQDVKARFKHQSLIQDFHDLQKDTDATRSRLEAAKQRKLMLAAEVRFLRRRYEHLVKTKTMGSAENGKIAQPPNSVKQKTKQVKEARKRVLPPLPEAKPKKRNSTVKEIAQNHKKIPLGKKMNYGKETLVWNATQVLDLNKNDLGSRNSVAAFDLNRDSTSSSPCGIEASLPTRAPIFDLNEISMGDEDCQFEEMKKSSMRSTSDDMQNDVQLSICRTPGEGPSRVGKRKISWMDPVALRV